MHIPVDILFKILEWTAEVLVFSFGVYKYVTSENSKKEESINKKIKELYENDHSIKNKYDEVSRISNEMKNNHISLEKEIETLKNSQENLKNQVINSFNDLNLKLIEEFKNLSMGVEMLKKDNEKMQSDFRHGLINVKNDLKGVVENADLRQTFWDNAILDIKKEISNIKQNNKG